jgi:hypothetical protein
MTIVVQRSFTIERGGIPEFERLSRESVWPYFEARGCKILGLFTNVYGGPSDELILLTAYESLAHWEATRAGVPPPAGSSPELLKMAARATEALRQRAKLTRVSTARVLRMATDWVVVPVRNG